MGIKGLWSVLNPDLESLAGDAAASEIADMVDGKRIAVDLSVWMCQAENMGSPAYTAEFSREHRIVKVVFERACNWLRFGCVPVAVLEGEIPEAKRAALRTRFRNRTGQEGGGCSSRAWTALARDISRVLKAMGLPVVQAPGEAEAMCSALNAAGLVDGVATVDGDAFLFGASVVYKELTLSALQPKSCSLARCSMDAVRRRLGISAGGAESLIAIAALSGGDYNETGASGVGPQKAFRLLRSVLEASPGEDDSGVLEALIERLAAGPDDALAAITKCTGCPVCGHYTGRPGRKCPQAAGCVQCGTQPAAEGGDGSGGCCPRPSTQPLAAVCRCPFHRLWLERHADKIVRQVGSQTGSATAIRATALEYRRQIRAAAEEAGRIKARLESTSAPAALDWRARPDPAAVEAALGSSVGWSLAITRRKLLPVLLEWDIANPQGAELVPRSIVKVSGKQGEGGPGGFRYLLEVESVQRPGLATFPPAPASDRRAVTSDPAGPDLSEPSSCGTAEAVTEWEYDRSCLKEPLARTVRMSSVRRHLSGLEDSFRSRVAGAAAVKQKPPSQRSTAKPLGSANTRPLTTVFRAKKTTVLQSSKKDAAPKRAPRANNGPPARGAALPAPSARAACLEGPSSGSPPKKQKGLGSPPKCTSPAAAPVILPARLRGHTAATRPASRVGDTPKSSFPMRFRLFDEAWEVVQRPGGDPLLNSSPSPSADSRKASSAWVAKQGNPGSDSPIVLVLGDSSDDDRDDASSQPPGIIDLTQSTPPVAKANSHVPDDDIIVLS